MVTVIIPEVERWLDRLYIGAEGAGLRREDRRKAVEVAAMLEEIRRAADRLSGQRTITLVDAAAGKSYLGLLAAKLVLEPMGRKAEILAIEQDARRVELSRRALSRLDTSIPIAFLAADVAASGIWPDRPTIVAALHACGPAADDIIAQSVAHQAQRLLLVPCCTGRSVQAARRAENAAAILRVPRQAPVRRRFIQAWVDAERTWRLEAAGYQTEVVEFVAPTVTPHNLLWRARLVSEPNRMQFATKSLGEMLAMGCRMTG